MHRSLPGYAGGAPWPWAWATYVGTDVGDAGRSDTTLVYNCGAGSTRAYMQRRPTEVPDRHGNTV